MRKKLEKNCDASLCEFQLRAVAVLSDGIKLRNIQTNQIATKFLSRQHNADACVCGMFKHQSMTIRAGKGQP